MPAFVTALASTYSYEFAADPAGYVWFYDNSTPFNLHRLRNSDWNLVSAADTTLFSGIGPTITHSSSPNSQATNQIGALNFYFTSGTNSNGLLYELDKSTFTATGNFWGNTTAHTNNNFGRVISSALLNHSNGKTYWAGLSQFVADPPASNHGPGCVTVIDTSTSGVLSHAYFDATNVQSILYRYGSVMAIGDLFYVIGSYQPTSPSTACYLQLISFDPSSSVVPNANDPLSGGGNGTVYSSTTRYGNIFSMGNTDLSGVSPNNLLGVTYDAGNGNILFGISQNSSVAIPTGQFYSWNLGSTSITQTSAINFWGNPVGGNYEFGYGWSIFKNGVVGGNVYMMLGGANNTPSPATTLYSVAASNFASYTPIDISPWFSVMGIASASPTAMWYVPALSGYIVSFVSGGSQGVFLWTSTATPVGAKKNTAFVTCT